MWYTLFDVCKSTIKLHFTQIKKPNTGIMLMNQDKTVQLLTHFYGIITFFFYFFLTKTCIAKYIFCNQHQTTNPVNKAQLVLKGECSFNTSENWSCHIQYDSSLLISFFYISG